MLTNLQEAIERIKVGGRDEADIQAIASATETGEIVLVSGSRAVGINGDLTDTSVLTGNKNVTGDRNVIIYGADAQALQSIISQHSSSGLFPEPDYSVNIETIKQIVREEIRLPRKEYGNSVGLGFNTLIELMQLPEVYSTVITFRVDFHTACEQINIIDKYKAVHDLLHTLEFQCYSVIVQEAKRFPDDEIALDNLRDYEANLQEILHSLQDIVQQESTVITGDRWLKDLKLARHQLQEAIEELDMQKLQNAIRILNRVLAIQPSQINTKLNTAARVLHLPSLVNAMTKMWEKLSASNVQQEKFQQFQEGVNAFSNLNSRLDALVKAHDYWQKLDLELRLIEANLERDLAELKDSWHYLKEWTASLFDQQADEWTMSFQQESQKLDAALDNQNPIMIKRHFRMYRRRASDRFFQVDVTLKHLCEELREIGVPLESILRMIE
jgi:hypothetical protein